MLSVWVLIILLMPCQLTYADSCTYICSKLETYLTRCGWFQNCERQRTVYKICNKECAINGGWSDYVVTETSACSAICGTGTQVLTYTRTCSKPAPSNGGLDCVGENTKTETQQCYSDPCPVHGGWSGFSVWKNYDECDVLCGGGNVNQWRSRTCTNPPPAFGGNECVGPSVENRTITCNNKICDEICPINNPVKFIAHETNKRRYYQCDNQVARLRRCPTGTVWNHDIWTCDHENAPGADQPPQVSGNTEQPAINCTGKLLVKDPTDCSRFYQCSFGKVVAGPTSCPSGNAFRSDISVCDFRSNVPGCE